MKFVFEIKETLTKRVEISANSIAEARILVNKSYNDGGIVLSADDFNDVKIIHIDENMCKREEELVKL